MLCLDDCEEVTLWCVEIHLPFVRPVCQFLISVCSMSWSVGHRISLSTIESSSKVVRGSELNQ